MLTLPSELFPIVQQIQTDLFDGGECGEEVCSFGLSHCAFIDFRKRRTPPSVSLSMMLLVSLSTVCTITLIFMVSLIHGELFT